MPESSGGLSDSLRQLADGEKAEAQDKLAGPDAGQPAAMPQGLAPVSAAGQAAPGESEEISAEIDDESGDILGAASMGLDSGATGQPRPTGPVRPMRPAHRRNDGFKMVLIPVCATVGVLLLIPAIWATLDLTGAIGQPDDDHSMTYLMFFAAWPMAILLLAGAFFLFRQVRRK